MITGISRFATRARVWTSCHSAGSLSILFAFALWLATAGLSRIGVPRLAPGVEQEPVDLQSFGLVAMAAACGITSVVLEDRHPWMHAGAARCLPVLRLAWVLSITAATVSLAMAASLLIPASLPKWSGFGLTCLLWWGVALVAAACFGRYAGLLTPLVLAVAASRGLVPWEWNLVFNSDLIGPRTGATGVLLAAGIIVYSIRSTATESRLRRR